MKCRFRRSVQTHTLAAACLLTAVACEQRSPTLPTTQEPIVSTPISPSPVAPPIVARLIIDIPSIVHLDDAPIKPVARAQFTDGSTGALPSSICLPKWSSSRQEVAGVTDGIVEVKGVGDVVIRADCDGELRGEAGLGVRRKVVGTVLERYGNVPTANARVQVVGTSAAGTGAITDQSGRFVLSVMDPDLEVEANASGLEMQRQHISVGAGDVLFRLDPAMLTTVWSGTFQRRSGRISKEAVGVPPNGEFEFETHHGGQIILSVTAGCGTFGTYDDFGANLWRDRDLSERLVSAHAYTPFTWVTGSGFAFPGRYFLAVSQFNHYAEDGCPWKLTLKRPH